MTLDMHITDKNNKTVVTPKNIRPTQLIGQKPKKKSKWWVWVIISILVIIFGGLGYIVYKGIDLSKKIGLNLNAGSLITEKQPELEKDSTGKYTNFLIVGIDTRPDQGGLNTDTMIVVSYNYDTNTIDMVSIPRDLSVEINNSGWYNKINSVYASAENKEKGTGMSALQQTVTKLTGIDIQYYALVNYQAFLDLIDAVGGIDINVPVAFTDTCYPADSSKDTGAHYGWCIDSEGWWKTVSFDTGVQHMDGKTALEYARSRHGEFSTGKDVTDFGRAIHQQEVIMAVKDKILNTSTLTSPKSIMAIISSIADNITTSGFTINDIQAGLNMAKNFSDNNGKQYSFVLDLEAGNKQLIANISTYDENGTLTAYLIGPKLGLGKYSDIHEYIQDILDKPELYSEKPLIYVYDSGLGYQETYQKTKDLQNQYPFISIVFGGSTKYDENGDYIYSDDTESTYPVTIEEFANTLNITNKTKPDFVTTNLYGDVTILLGKQTQTEE
jgi:LCP family protein required for cell wall assembly